MAFWKSRSTLIPQSDVAQILWAVMSAQLGKAAADAAQTFAPLVVYRLGALHHPGFTSEKRRSGILSLHICDNFFWQGAQA